MSKFGSALGGFKAGLGRTKQQVLEKIGKVEETNDPQIQAERERFNEDLKHWKTLEKSFKKYNKLLIELNQVSAEISRECQEVFNENPDEILKVSVEFSSNIELLDQQRNTYDVNSDSGILEPLDHHLNQYKEMQKKYSELNKWKIDRDRYHREVVKLSEKVQPHPNLPLAKEKYEDSKIIYEDILQEVLVDFPALHSDATPFLKPVFSRFIELQKQYFDNMTQQITGLYEQVKHIDTYVNKRDWVIIPNVVERTSLRPQNTPNQNYSDNLPNYNEVQQTAPVQEIPETTIQNLDNSIQDPPESDIQDTVPLDETRLTVTAIYDFESDDPDDLPFLQGDVLTILEQEGDWWHAELNGKIGIIPANYVTVNE